jgi:hypothetical protein
MPCPAAKRPDEPTPLRQYDAEKQNGTLPSEIIAVRTGYDGASPLKFDG